MTEAKRERGIKVMVKRRIWLEDSNGNPYKVPVGEIIVLSKEQVKHFGDAVTRDVPLGDDDED